MQLFCRYCISSVNVDRQTYVLNNMFICSAEILKHTVNFSIQQVHSLNVIYKDLKTCAYTVEKVWID